ncbi:hypothetical protein EZS27_012738 [termite gut metagenome]|uniref:IPT/TIG domain-containing protein n=1 Tax=termite gut metagenome TaxID=433724 RepID=A0A5J4S282_9ZZZZ
MIKRVVVNRKLCLAALCCLSIFGMLSSCDKDKKETSVYDPSREVKVTSFYPDSGRIAEKVMFVGENFGTEPDSISVWFNNKQGRVIGSNGTYMYVIVPRTPGDTCTVKVQIGSQILTLEQKFRYKVSVSVSTICGNGTFTFREGDLSYAQMRPRYVTVDDEDNIFVIQRSDGLDGLIRVNETENVVQLLGQGMNAPNALTVDKVTGMITVPADSPPEIFFNADPREGWAVRTRNLSLDFAITGGNSGDGRYKHSMAFCEADGKVYVRYRSGDIARIDPETYLAERIYTTVFGDSYGLAFHPLHPTWLYMAMGSECGANAHSICFIDVSDPEHTFRQLSASNMSGGFRDGKLENAQFRYPCQIYFDPEGNLYIADRDNHCIRRLTVDNVVETVVGMPGTSGFKDGNSDEALFKAPWGVGVGKDGTVYVADYDNGRLRKLAIE